MGETALQIFFDDSVRNVQAGKQIGLYTVLVNPFHPTLLSINFHLELNIFNPTFLPPIVGWYFSSGQRRGLRIGEYPQH